MPQFVLVLIPYINLLNVSWIKKNCLFLRNMEPLIVSSYFLTFYLILEYDLSKTMNLLDNAIFVHFVWNIMWADCSFDLLI